MTKLPKAESDLPEWQAAIGALMLVADLGGPTMFERIGPAARGRALCFLLAGSI
jgi:hypothetical protein